VAVAYCRHRRLRHSHCGEGKCSETHIPSLGPYLKPRLNHSPKTTSMEIPIIDFSAFLDPASSKDAKLEVAKNLDQACREVGFFYLSGHGIDSSVFTEMLSNAKQFFTTASSEEKGQIKVRPSGEGDGDDSRGYRAVKRADAGYEVSLKNE
jgi:isopenicillin N synthase-like dioxygenase